LQENPNPLIEIVLPLEDGRVLMRQLNELEFRRSEVTALLKQLLDLKAENTAVLAEVHKQLDLERQAHSYTRTELKQAEERATFYKGVYEDLKKPPPSKGISLKWKVITVAGVVVAGAVIGYVVTR